MWIGSILVYYSSDFVYSVSYDKMGKGRKYWELVKFLLKYSVITIKFFCILYKLGSKDS